MNKPESARPQGRSVKNYNRHWSFHERYADWLLTDFCEGQIVDLPHNAVDQPYNYLDDRMYQRLFCYQKRLTWQSTFANNEVVLQFDAAMANARVYINGVLAGSHRDGYTPFEIRLTDHLGAGDNLICVVIDGSEDPTIPPFGGQIDYLTYAGLYRDVWLIVRAPIFIDKMKIETPNPLAKTKSVVIDCRVGNPRKEPVQGILSAALLDTSGSVVARVKGDVESERVILRLNDLGGMQLWDIDEPALYVVALELETSNGKDYLSTCFGFRTAEFKPEGFFLNGRRLKLRGLNRHQSFPYVGYAMGRCAQEADAEIVKHKLKCNIVRTSHYPQSPWFLNHCDRIGLLVFEEIPGWQHIGDEAWQRQAVSNVRSMIERDWNHPSIVLWGVRINESPDAHDFYLETNRVAHELDPTRQTGGVRCIEASELLEDVYTMNDFCLGAEEMPGSNSDRIALRDPREVVALPKSVPYLVSEFNGHMFPTKRFDNEERQNEHVIRHLQVLNAAYGNDAIAGCIGWCLFDYNTHKDFGSGDSICHHGVLDMYREPKFAAYVYASQCDPEDEVILRPVTYWSRGDRNIGGVLPLIILTNCDEIEFSFGSDIVRRFVPDRVSYPHLPHPPVVIDERHERQGPLGAWGMAWEDCKLVGFVAGKPVKTVRMAARPLPKRLQIEPDRTRLRAGEDDSVRVMIRLLDQFGNVLPFADDFVVVDVDGPATIVGPPMLSLRGGRAGFWIRTTGATGPISINAACAPTGQAEIKLQVT